MKKKRNRTLVHGTTQVHSMSLWLTVLSRSSLCHLLAGWPWVLLTLYNCATLVIKSEDSWCLSQRAFVNIESAHRKNWLGPWQLSRSWGWLPIQSGQPLGLAQPLQHMVQPHPSSAVPCTALFPAFAHGTWAVSDSFPISFVQTLHSFQAQSTPVLLEASPPSRCSVLLLHLCSHDTRFIPPWSRAALATSEHQAWVTHLPPPLVRGGCHAFLKCCPLKCAG